MTRTLNTDFLILKTGANLKRKNSKDMKAIEDLVGVFYARPEIVIDTDSYFYD